jgi:hypothetical protein
MPKRNGITFLIKVSEDAAVKHHSSSSVAGGVKRK